MRRSFATIISDSGVDIESEYRSLYALLFGRDGFYYEMEYNFDSMPFKGTTISLQDFNQRYGFDFENVPASRSEDYLLLLCEYACNFAIHLTSGNVFSRSLEVLEHVRSVAEKLMHSFIENKEGLYELVPTDSRTLAAAEVAPEYVAVDLVHYDYRGCQGDLEEKRSILSKLCLALEPKRDVLRNLSKKFTNDLFYLANNLNIRHNNIDPANSGKYHERIAQMEPAELESLYDDLHGMCAAAFLLLRYEENAEAVQRLKG